MTSFRFILSGSLVAVAVGVLGLSACGNGEPSGLTPITPSASGSSSSPPISSKWTPQQQQVIDGYFRFIDFQTAISTKAEKVDMAKAHRVAKEPFATVFLKDIDKTLSAGYIQSGKALNTISSVTAAGNTATIKTCLDQTHLILTNPSHPSAPRWEPGPPSRASVSLVHEGDSWLVSGFKGGEGTCASG